MQLCSFALCTFFAKCKVAKLAGPRICNFATLHFALFLQSAKLQSCKVAKLQSRVRAQLCNFALCTFFATCKVAKLQILGDFSAPIFDRGERMPRTTEKPNGGSWAIFRVPTLTEASRRPRTNEKPKRRILVDFSGPKFDRGERMSQNNRKTQRRRSFGSWVAKLRACTTCKVAKLRACVKPLRACGHEAVACVLQDDAASVRSVCANRPHFLQETDGTGSGSREWSAQDEINFSMRWQRRVAAD